jgi:hypothetical protein
MIEKRAKDRRKAGRLQRRDHRVLLGAVALAMIAAVGVDQARAALVRAERDLAAATADMAQARVQEAAARKHTALVAALGGLEQQARLAGLDARLWSAREINVRQQTVPRAQANETLLGIARSNGQLLKLEEFELSVTNADEGLFDAAGGARLPVMLSLRGVTNFRIAGGAP